MTFKAYVMLGHSPLSVWIRNPTRFLSGWREGATFNMTGIGHRPPVGIAFLERGPICEQQGVVALEPVIRIDSSVELMKVNSWRSV